MNLISLKIINSFPLNIYSNHMQTLVKLKGNNDKICDKKKEFDLCIIKVLFFGN